MGHGDMPNMAGAHNEPEKRGQGGGRDVERESATEVGGGSPGVSKSGLPAPAEQLGQSDTSPLRLTGSGVLHEVLAILPIIVDQNFDLTRIVRYEVEGTKTGPIKITVIG